MTKLSIYLLFALIIFSNRGFSQVIPKIDSLIYMGTKGYTRFVWCSEDVCDQIFLSKDTNLFTHNYRQHLLVQNYYGRYSYHKDTLILECIFNCDNDFKGIKLGPIIIPMFDSLYNKDTVIVYRSDGSNDLLIGKLFRTEDGDSIVINDKGNFYSEVVTDTANYYLIKIDYEFSAYDAHFMKKGIVRSNTLFMDNKKYIKSEHAPDQQNQVIVKRKRKKHKVNQ